MQDDGWQVECAEQWISLIEFELLSVSFKDVKKYVFALPRTCSPDQ